MKNLKQIGLAALLITCTLAGCNKQDDVNELVIATMGTPVEVSIINTFIDGFLAKPENEGKSIKVVKITESYDSWVNKKLYVNQMPDVIQVFDYSSEYWTSSENLYQPISDLMERDNIKESDYFESVMEMCKSGTDDKVYWVPRDYNKVVCIYNKKMFDAANVSYPQDNWTYNDFLSTCQALNAKADEISSYSKSLVFYPVDANLKWAAVYYPAIKSYGGELIDKDNSLAFKNIDAVKKGFNLLLNTVEEGYAVEPSSTTAPFANKQAAMMFVSRPDIPAYVKSLGKEAIDFVSMPTFSDKTSEQSYVGMGCTGYGITSDCPNEKKEFAWSFLKYVISADGQNEFCKMGSGIPVLKSLANDENAEFRKYLPNANNDCFVNQPERDLPMTYMKGFKPSKQLGIYSYINKNFLASFYQNDEFYATAKRELESIFNK